MLLGFILEIGEIKVSICVRLNRDDLQTSHNSGLEQKRKLNNTLLHKNSTYSGIGTMSTQRNQAYIAVAFTTRLMVCANNGQTSIFTSGT